MATAYIVTADYFLARRQASSNWNVQKVHENCESTKTIRKANPDDFLSHNE